MPELTNAGRDALMRFIYFPPRTVRRAAAISA